MKELRSIAEIVCGLLVCLNVAVFAVPATQLADECRLLEQLLVSSKVSPEEIRQTRQRLEQELPQYADSAEKARAYLLAAKLESELLRGQKDTAALMRLLAASLNIKQIEPLDEIEARFLYAVGFVEKDENKDVIEQCKQVRQVSARCLNEGCHKTSAMRGTVTPFRLVMTDWEVAAEFEAEALEKGNKSAEAVMVLSDFGNHIIPLAMKEDQQEHERARFLASTAWIKCMKILKHTDQNGLSEPFTAALGSFPDTNNNPEFEQVRITLQLARAMINSNVPQQSLDNALGVIEHNADNPAIGKAVLYFTSYMKAPEQYDYLQKLLTLYRTHPEYNPSASVYWSAGLNASVLGRKDEAIQIFVEFLQKFPKDTLRNEVEEELRNLRQKQTDNK